MFWKPYHKNQFKKQFKNLDQNIQKQVADALSHITTSENPALLGEYKTNLRIFAYDIGRKYRIIYNINWKDKTIEFIRVCDHKSAYMKD